LKYLFAKMVIKALEIEEEIVSRILKKLNF